MSAAAELGQVGHEHQRALGRSAEQLEARSTIAPEMARARNRRRSRAPCSRATAATSRAVGGDHDVADRILPEYTEHVLQHRAREQRAARRVQAAGPSRVFAREKLFAGTSTTSPQRPERVTSRAPRRNCSTSRASLPPLRHVAHQRAALGSTGTLDSRVLVATFDHQARKQRRVVASDRGGATAASPASSGIIRASGPLTAWPSDDRAYRDHRHALERGAHTGRPRIGSIET